MSKIYFIFIFSFLTTFNLFSQSNWSDNILLSPDSVSHYNFPDSCLIINESSKIVYLDSIYSKYPASYYYCAIKLKDKYLVNYFLVTGYGYADSIKLKLNPNDSLTFLIVGIDPCPICKIKYDEFLRDTLLFRFTADSGLSSTTKYLIFNSDIRIGVGVNDKSEMPTKFYLWQNYPNPFNPTTKIRYSVPSVETRNIPSMQLKVYDMLGREVANLIKEIKQPGNYEVEFNGSKLPSGVYLYQLRFGNLISTKKLILLK